MARRKKKVAKAKASPAKAKATAKQPRMKILYPWHESHVDWQEYHLGSAGKAKFWAVKVEGYKRTIRSGRVGTAGRKESAEFEDALEAWADARRRITAIRGKGYEPVSTGEARIPDLVLRTPPSPIDIEERFPELAALRATTVRLHPVPCENPPVGSSHMGGRILWPADEPWPATDEKQHPLGDRRTPNRTFVPVVQLRREDVPELPFPDGTDLFQLLWNPRSHPAHGYGPLPLVYWRRAAEMTELLGEQPIAEMPDTSMVPRPCSVHPERVTEYPCPLELPPPLREKVLRETSDEDEEEESATYQYLSSVAPGIKVGGFAYYHIIDPPPPFTCSRGHPMHHFITIDGTEYDGGSGPRWCARISGDWKGEQTANPTGMRIGRDGNFIGYVCSRCKQRPIRWVPQ
jgi:predicted DNA-binding WGR domain protein